MGLLLALVLLAEPAPARPATLSWEPRVDIPVTAVLGVAWIGSEALFKKQLAPASCRWCATNGFDTAVRSLFNPQLTPSAFGIAGPDTASNVIGFGLLPLAVFGVDALLSWHDDSFRDAFWADAVIILEATMSAMVLNQAVKFLVGRGRPYTVGASPELLATGRDPTDHDLSFFSGHTTFTFGLAASLGVVATMRGYRYAWVTWVVGLPLALTTALLRLGADKHWATDVLTGMVVAGGFAVLVPAVFHGPKGLTARIVPSGQGVSVVGTF